MGGKTKDTEGSQGIGERFQGETKYSPEKMGGYSLDWDSFPESFKDYETPLARINLPKPELGGDLNIWQALFARRSVRDYEVAGSMPLGVLSGLLWATQGITARYGTTYFRTAPSAGGLYPVETYLNVRAVDDLEPGIYHFRPHKFDLELLKRGDFGRQLASAALGQNIMADAQAGFIWSAVLARGKWKYRQRAYRYIYLDAGHIAENLYLAATALGLGVCAVGAFFDDQANGLLDLDGVEETVIYMASVGLLSFDLAAKGPSGG
jgi:SagB-type dehydrogenase family enzyme